MYYTLINSISGTTHGMWSNPYSAEVFKMSLDDWMYWSVININDI